MSLVWTDMVQVAVSRPAQHLGDNDMAILVWIPRCVSATAYAHFGSDAELRKGSRADRRARLWEVRAPVKRSQGQWARGNGCQQAIGVDPFAVWTFVESGRACCLCWWHALPCVPSAGSSSPRVDDQRLPGAVGVEWGATPSGRTRWRQPGLCRARVLGPAGCVPGTWYAGAKGMRRQCSSTEL